MSKFLHTADWQIGKRFEKAESGSRQERLRQQRVETVRGLRALIEEAGLAFVVVCGDLFDSSTPEASTVSALCSAVGALEVPVYAIPGNHDHGGPGGVWDQAFFKRERAALAPNLHVLLNPEPVVVEGHAVLFPCPLLRRHEANDPTAWLRIPPTGVPEDLPWIVLAHGSVQGFSSRDAGSGGINQIDLDRLPHGVYDYIALGDWHGCKEILPAVWYSGTPEQDRFSKGAANRPGHVLTVEVPARGDRARITEVAVGNLGWHEWEAFSLNGDADLEVLERQLEERLAQRAGQDLVRLKLSGALSYAGLARLQNVRTGLEARHLRVDWEAAIRAEPTDDELRSLMARQDPLISTLATELHEQMTTDPYASELLRELYLQIESLAQ